MEDEGKIVNLETDDEEEDLQAFIKEIEVDEEMEEDIQSVCAAAKLPKYVPPWKGRVKVRKDLDVVKGALQTLFLLDGILFEGSVLGRMPMMKFEYWDLTDSEKFPHLETERFIKQSTEGPITTLEPQKWLRGVEKAIFLHLLWIPHFHVHPLLFSSSGSCSAWCTMGTYGWRSLFPSWWISSIEFLGFHVRERTPRK